MNRGGFPEFVAVIASCSAIAAIMSTADSAVIGVTNVVSMDFLKNWLFIAKPDLDTPKFMNIFSKVTSAIIVLLGVCVALYDEELNNDSSVYGRMISWQNMLLWQSVPTCLLGCYMRKAKAWALIGGYICGYASIFFFYWYKDIQMMCDSKSTYGTTFATIADSTMGADGVKIACTPAGDNFVSSFYLDSAVWAGFINLFVSFVLSFLSFPEDSASFAINTGGRHGAKRLDHDTILEIMKGTTEPIFTKIGVICICITTALVNLSIPWYGTQYDGCNFLSYAGFAKTGETTDGCSGGNYIGGIPTWAFVMIICFVAALFSNVTAFLQWKTIDEEDFSEMTGMTKEKENGSKISPANTAKKSPALPSLDAEAEMVAIKSKDLE